jgi:transcriptional regulator with XRE-family HTH domain
MSVTSRGRKGRVINELARRIASLREGLSLGQRPFAEKVSAAAANSKARVSHTQISEWERGTEIPSVDKLIALGVLARSAEERVWFWAKVGINEEMIRATFSEIAKNNVPATAAEVVKVSVSKNLSLGEDGDLLFHADRSLFLPVDQFGSALFINCLEVAESLPGVLSVGDIAIVDRSPVDPARLLDSMVAIFFEQRPPFEGRAVTPKQFSQLRRKAKHVSQMERRRDEQLLRDNDPEGFAARERARESTWHRVETRMAQSVIRFGWLGLKPAGGWGNGPWEDQLSRATLELSPPSDEQTGYCIPLSEWQKGLNPLEPRIAEHFKPPIHIVGRVIGWFRGSAPLPSEARVV